MTPQQLIDMPGYGSAQNQVIKQKNWDYDYPDYFLSEVEKITGVQLTEHQRTQLIDVYDEILEGYE